MKRTKKKIGRIVVMMSLLLTMAASTCMAQGFSYYGLENKSGTTLFHACTDSKNQKIYAGANWNVIARTMSFTVSVSNTYGMAFVPMVKNSAYMLCGGKKVWSKTAMTSRKYSGWDSGRGEVGYYYLGVRLDTDLTNCQASVSGDWNSN